MDKLQSSGAVSRVDLDETEGKKRTLVVLRLTAQCPDLRKTLKRSCRNKKGRDIDEAPRSQSTAASEQLSFVLSFFFILLPAVLVLCIVLLLLCDEAKETTEEPEPGLPLGVNECRALSSASVHPFFWSWV